MKSSTVQQLILELLQKEHVHFSAQEVYQHLKPRLPSVNPSTVYRALERLASVGEISVSDMGTGAAVYEMVGSPPHHHLVCEMCHKVFTLENKLVQPFFTSISDQFRFEITTNHLVLFGYCETCRQNRNIKTTGEST
jgi:Fur family ferric uptake transcriptional regulator